MVDKIIFTILILALPASIFAADTKVMNGTLWTRTYICQESKKLEGKIAQEAIFVINGTPTPVIKEKIEEAGQDTKFAYKVKATGEVIKIVHKPKIKDTMYADTEDNIITVGADD